MVKFLRFVVYALLGLILSFQNSALFAQGQINPYFFFTSPPAPVGSGARAMGVGGAFIAVADDATAAMWNPGALIQLELPEASVVLDSNYRNIDSQTATLYDVNFVSMSYPFTIQDVNMILSLNYQRLFDYYLDFENSLKGDVIASQDASYLVKGTGSGATRYDVISVTGINLALDSEITGKVRGELGTVSPAFAIQITPKFSLGFTANFWKDGWFNDGGRYRSEHEEKSNGEFSQFNALWWDTDGDCTCNGGHKCDDTVYYYIDDPSCMDQLIPGNLVGGNPTYSKKKSFQTVTRTKQRMRMQGQSYNFGLLWDITPRWTLGAVYRTGAVIEVDREYRWFREQTSGWASLNQAPVSGEVNYDEHLTLPSAYGLGVGFRYSDALSFTSDVTVVRWDEYYYEPEKGDKYSLVTGLKKGVDDVAPTVTARVGAEYLIIKPKYVVPIRGGFFWDQEPAIPNSDNYYGLTVGSGFAYKWFITDLTYFYRLGRDVHVGYSANAERTELVEDAKGDVDQHQVMLSFIFHTP